MLSGGGSRKLYLAHGLLDKVEIKLLKISLLDDVEEVKEEEEDVYGGYITRRPRGYMTINVGGRIYRIAIDLLASKRNTLFEKMIQGVDDIPNGYHAGVNKYFIDRNADVFHSVVHFFKTGVLHVPKNVCSKVIHGELKYWHIRQLRVESCCFSHYQSQLNDTKNAQKIIRSVCNCDYQNEAASFFVDLSNNQKRLLKLRSLLSFTEKKQGLAKVSFTCTCIFYV